MKKKITEASKELSPIYLVDNQSIKVLTIHGTNDVWVPYSQAKLLDQQLKEKHKLDFSWKETWYSKKFGQRIPRKSLCIMGFINKGNHDFSLKLPLSK